MKKKDWLVPLTGLAFLVFLIVGFIVAGDPPEADHDAQEIVDFYVDNKDAVSVGALLTGVAAVLFVFFANYLRTLFRGTSASVTILAGAAIFATGGAIDSTILIATADAADDIPAESVQTMQALWDNDFLPVAVGMVVFLWSLAISILRTDVLPRWLGWVTLALAVIATTPVGFFAFPLAGLLVLVLSIWLTMRARRGAAPAAAAMGPPD